MQLWKPNRMQTLVAVSAVALAILAVITVNWLHDNGMQKEAVELIGFCLVGIKLLSMQIQAIIQHRKITEDNSKTRHDVQDTVHAATLNIHNDLDKALHAPAPEQTAMPRTPDELTAFIRNIGECICSPMADKIKSEILTEKRREHDEMRRDFDDLRKEMGRFQVEIRGLIRESNGHGPHRQHRHDNPNPNPNPPNPD